MLEMRKCSKEIQLDTSLGYLTIEASVEGGFVTNENILLAKVVSV